MVGSFCGWFAIAAAIFQIGKKKSAGSEASVSCQLHNTTDRMLTTLKQTSLSGHFAHMYMVVHR